MLGVYLALILSAFLVFDSYIGKKYCNNLKIFLVISYEKHLGVYEGAFAITRHRAKWCPQTRALYPLRAIFTGVPAVPARWCADPARFRVNGNSDRRTVPIAAS